MRTSDKYRCYMFLQVTVLLWFRTNAGIIGNELIKYDKTCDPVTFDISENP